VWALDTEKPEKSAAATITTLQPWICCHLSDKANIESCTYRVMRETPGNEVIARSKVHRVASLIPVNFQVSTVFTSSFPPFQLIVLSLHPAKCRCSGCGGTLGEPEVAHTHAGRQVLAFTPQRSRCKMFLESKARKVNVSRPLSHISRMPCKRYLLHLDVLTSAEVR
jgi:hypothetical protein